MGDITRILTAAKNGDSAAFGDLLARVYDELRALAATKLANERRDHTLQPMALVNEQSNRSERFHKSF